MITDPGRVPLGRRAWIGDGRRGASVTADGTVDWYCSSGLTGEPDLWRLLDPSGPAVRVGPVRDGGGATRHLPPSRQAYCPATNVVETVMDAGGGRSVAVSDFMPWPGPGLESPGGIVRLVRSLSGPVDVEIEVIPGWRRGTEVAPSTRGLLAASLEIGSPVPFRFDPFGRDGDRWRAVLRLDAGEEAVVTIGPRQVDLPATPTAAHRAMEDTEEAWRSWLAGAAIGGAYRPGVERALLAVRVLTGPGGATHSSGTACLPRRVGSERSSDDRWVRLADVAAAAPILAAAGLVEDAEAAEAWMRGTLSNAHLPWPAWFDADGQPVPEAEDWPFAGWRGSGPVRWGRDAIGADIGTIGHVVAAIGSVRSGPFGRPGDSGPLAAAWPALAEATDWATDRWRQPDPGRWEIPRPTRRYVAGRLDLWYALDRMARLARAANPLDLQAVAWQQEARELLRWLEGPALAPDGGLRMDGGSDADDADSALLSVTDRGPWAPWHPIVEATVDRILERLGSDLLLYRYSDRVSDDRAGPDNPDLQASLLAVRALGRMGRWDEAHERMEAVEGRLGAGSGHFSETVDPLSGDLLGNFPCPATALAFVEAALTLETGPP